MSEALSESDFRLAADAALAELETALSPLADAHDFEIDQRDGVLQVEFEEPTEARFVVSPNAPVRQIWVSAMARGYKLNWSPEQRAFVLEGETLVALTSRLVRQFLGA